MLVIVHTQEPGQSTHSRLSSFFRDVVVTTGRADPFKWCPWIPFRWILLDGFLWWMVRNSSHDDIPFAWLAALLSTGSRCTGSRSCGLRVYLLFGMWNLLRAGIKPMSPAMADRFFTTAPSGKCLFFFLFLN